MNGGVNGGCVGLKGGGNSSILHLVGGGGGICQYHLGYLRKVCFRGY